METIVINIILGISLFFTLVVVVNFFTAPVIREMRFEDEHLPEVTVLIPARNEESVIKNCIESVMSQTYGNFSVIVLDDNSDDNTGNILKSMDTRHKKLRIIKGKALPVSWVGKNWACHQLAREAPGQMLLFIDADCFLETGALESAVAYMKKYGLSLLSSFPTQVMRTFSELLVVPSMNWLLLTFLPLRMVYLSSWLSFVAANGQFMLFQRNAYEEIGGHERIASEVVEDMEFARLIKRKGLRMMTALGGKLVFCRMYDSLDDSINGFSKNFYPGFKMPAIAFLFLLLFFTLIFIAPFFFTVFDLSFAWCVLLILIQRFLISLICRQNFLFNMIFHPVQMFIMIYVGIKSIWQSKNKGYRWKGRWISQN
ncbi:glycosyltransferase [Spirochaetota bacterium]